VQNRLVLFYQSAKFCTSPVIKSKLLDRIPFLKTSANERDEVIRKNVLGSVLFQFFSSVLGLLIVPMCLTYIDKEKYGILINASIMIAWLQNMNFGMGFGMQNKVAEAIANNKPELAQEYVTIVYRYTTLISVALFFLGLIASFFIDWNQLFNSSVSASDLRAITFIAFISFLAYFIFGNIIPLFNALKQTSVPKLFGLFTNVLTIFFLFIINKYSHGNLALIALALALPTPLLYFIGNLIFFAKGYRYLRPNWRVKNKKHINDVFSLGIRFFIMQMTTLIIFQSGTFIVTQMLGPSEVTPFTIINRYFYFIYFIFTLATTPYWSAFTEAYIKKDFLWIKKHLRILIIGAVISSFVVFIMLLLSFYFIPVWSNYSFDLHQYKPLLYSSAILITLQFFLSIVTTFLNGISKLKLQLIMQIGLACITIPLNIFFIREMEVGSAAVNIVLSLCIFIYIVIAGLQIRYILKSHPRL